jgi:inosine-uridine nucleoside N-ribohydrolase
LTGFFCLCAGCNQQKASRAVPIIFDSDIGPDYDDVGAIAILHALAEQGKANILATIASNQYEGIAGILKIFNTYYGAPDIPIGVPKTEGGVTLRDSQHWTDTLLANYKGGSVKNADVPDAVQLYRKILAAQPDTSVTIVTVGFLTNLADLLRSAPDQYAPVDGKTLVKQKVHLLVSMAGGFPSGKEFNIYSDLAASKYALSQWPTTVIFSGVEIGNKIKTGLPLIHNDAIKNSPVKDVFRIAIPQDPGDRKGRSSWDETTVLVSINGPEPYFTLHPGRIIISDDGNNRWNDEARGQYYLVPKAPLDNVAEVINQLMMKAPMHR